MTGMSQDMTISTTAAPDRAPDTIAAFAIRRAGLRSGGYGGSSPGRWESGER